MSAMNPQHPFFFSRFHRVIIKIYDIITAHVILFYLRMIVLYSCVDDTDGYSFSSIGCLIDVPRNYGVRIQLLQVMERVQGAGFFSRMWPMSFKSVAHIEKTQYSDTI